MFYIYLRHLYDLYLIFVEYFWIGLVWVFIVVYVLELVSYLYSNILNLWLISTIHSYLPYNPEMYVLLVTWYQLSSQSSLLYYHWIIWSNFYFTGLRKLTALKYQVIPNPPYFYGLKTFTHIFCPTLFITNDQFLYWELYFLELLILIVLHILVHKKIVESPPSLNPV